MALLQAGQRTLARFRVDKADVSKSNFEADLEIKAGFPRDKFFS